MSKRNHKLRHNRKKLARSINKGEAELRVFGSSESGYVLCGFINDNIVGFTQVHDKQSDAVIVGERRFKQKAKKLINIPQKSSGVTGLPLTNKN